MIYVNGTRQGIVGTLVYLGSNLSWNGSLDAEMHACIQKASVAFGMLEKEIMSDRSVAFQTKVTVYWVCMLSCYTHERHGQFTTVT